MTFAVTTHSGYNRENSGQHATELVFSFTGPKGAAVWRMVSGVTPIGVYTSGYESRYDVNLREPSAMGFAFHEELTEANATADEFEIHDNCDFLGGRACVCRYITGSRDKPMMKAFAAEGFDGVRKLLEHEYETF